MLDPAFLPAECGEHVVLIVVVAAVLQLRGHVDAGALLAAASAPARSAAIRRARRRRRARPARRGPRRSA